MTTTAAAAYLGRLDAVKDPASYEMFTPEGDAAAARIVFSVRVALTPDLEYGSIATRDEVLETFRFYRDAAAAKHPEINDTAVRDILHGAVNALLDAAGYQPAGL